MKMEFGLHTPEAEHAEVAMGARIIYHGLGAPRLFDLVSDRVSWNQPPSDPDHVIFVKWISHTFLDELSAWCSTHGILPADEDVFDFSSDGFAGRACPNGSCGYIYFDCWKL